MEHEGRLKAALADRYQIEREIGSGGMATVYMAQDLKHDRKVAVKVMKPELAAVMGTERFLAEIRTTANLQHPHILPLFDSGEADGFLFYVMPYVEGESLRQRLERRGQLPIEDAVRIARGTADALAYAHEQGVIHRDVKPANIMLEAGHALLVDFGVATALAQADEDRLTRTGLSVGTPAYMSPEQSVGADEVDGRADLYALGCVFFEMLVGQPPFTSRTAQGVLAQHVNRAPPSPIVRRPEVPVWLDRVVLRLLAKDPAQRFQAADKLTAELAVHSDSNLDAVTDPWMRWLYRIHRRRWALFAASMILFLAATGLAYLRLGRDPGGGPLDRPPLTNVVVYPLQDLSELDRADLANGLTDRLTDHLGSLSPLTVVPFLTMREHVRTGLPLDSIVLRHQVGTIIGGTILATDREVQVLLELTDAGTNARFASTGPLIRPRGELILLLGELADELTRLLRRRIGWEVSRRELEAGTECSECLELLFRASQARREARPLWVAGETEAASRILAEADSILGYIEDLDPDWVAPILERGWIATHRARRFTPRAGSYDTTSARQGIARAERVLQMDSENGEALALRGVLRFYLAQEAEDSQEQARLWAGAQEDLETAVRINPYDANAWNALSNIRRREGRFQEAKEASEKALVADAWLLNDEDTVFRLCEVSMELEEAEDVFHWCVAEGRRRFPDRLGFVSAELVLLASWEGWAPDPDWAWALADTALDLASAGRRASYRPLFWMDVAAVLARGGHADSARAVIRGARSIAATEEPWLDYREAHARLQLGEKNEAMRLLDRFLAAMPDRRAYVAKDWWFRSLRGDSDFRALVEKG